MTEYGLNVYFDGDFDVHNDIWIWQFPENMKSYDCKGVIAFLDPAYTVSHATAMELMYSQTIDASYGTKEECLPVVPIYLDNLRITSEQEQINTGLGCREYPDGTINEFALKEKELFDSTFDELLDRDILGKSKHYYKKKYLNGRACNKIIIELLNQIGANKNVIGNITMESIALTIADACGEAVFSPEKKIKPITEEDSSEKADTENDNTKENDSTPKTTRRKSPLYSFTLYGKRYDGLKLKYYMLTVFKEVMAKHTDKLDLLLSSLSCLHEGDMIGNRDFSSIFRAGERVEIAGRTVSIGTSLGKGAVQGYIDKLIKLCGESQDILVVDEQTA